MKNSEKIILFILMVLLMAAGGMATLGTYAALDSSIGEFQGGQASTEVELKRVRLRAPLIIQLSRDQVVRPGDEIILDARVEVMEGDPLTKTEWRVSKDGGKSYSGVVGNSLLFQTSQELNTPPHLPYYYKLRVENEGGVDEAIVQVLVIQNPAEYRYRTLTDLKTGVSISGLFHKGVERLEVTQKNVNDYPDMTSLVAEEHVPLSVYEVSLISSTGEMLPYVGMLDLDMPVGTVFETDQLRVFHKKTDDTIEILYGLAKEGRVQVETNSLSPFLIEAPRSKTYVIEARKSGYGRVEPNGTVYVAEGESQTFVFKPDANHKLSGIKIDGIRLEVSGNQYTLTNVRKDHSLLATFIRYTDPDTNGGGSGDGNGGGGGGDGNSGGGSGDGNGGGGNSGGGNSGGGSGDGNSGGGSGDGNSGGGSGDGNSGGGSGGGNTGGGSGNGNPGGGSGAIQENGLDNLSGQEKYYKITVRSHGKGRISPSKPVMVKRGKSKPFYFYPDKGYEVERVLVNGMEIPVKGNGYTFQKVTEDANIEVYFRKKTGKSKDTVHTVMAIAGSGGRISPSHITKVRSGGDLYIYFIPNEGYRVATVTVDGEEVETGNSYHMRNITSDKVIEVSFEEGENLEQEKLFEVYTWVDTKGGSVSPDGKGWINEGGSQTIYFYPEEGYELEKLLVNGEPVEIYSGSYTLKEVSENMEVIVSYQKADTKGNRKGCDCKICALWGGCYCPWCWLIPLILVIILLISWRMYNGRKKGKRQGK